MKYFLILIGLFISCSTPQQSTLPSDDDITLIQEVNIINVRSGEVSKNKFVLIKEGKISDILDEKPALAENTTVIEGKGQFLMPGLAEMHAHIPSPDWGRENIEETLFLYLSNGVTTIRGMLGHPLHLELREQTANNEVLSPRIFTSSPSLNGNTVRNVEEAETKVRTYNEAGYDFLKLHPGIQLEVFDAIVKTANEVGITFAGHVSTDVGIRHALESGYASIDHVDGFIEGLVPKEKGLDPNTNGFFGYNFTYDADPKLIDELVAMTNTYKVWVVPTQSLFDRWFSPDEASTLATAPEMKYMPKTTLENWIKSKENLISDPEYSTEKWNAFNTLRLKIIYNLQKKGHGLLLGSDAPQVFNVPGFSIHHELAGMLAAGLSPLEAIQIGTINPATFLNKTGEFGEIIKGASADCILVANNPLEDLQALRAINGVMVRGKWLSKKFIDNKLEEISKNATQ
ncbi:MAG: amidohydrolase family protein [Bacteroidota bacterium]